MDSVDRLIINSLQGGFPLCERPYAAAAEAIGLDEDTLLARLEHLLATHTLTRFGPLYHAERLGGATCLCAMAVPEPDFETVAEQVNGFDEVAHNYARDHRFNMWFVIATEHEEQVADVIKAIERVTALRVFALPKLEEFYVGLRFEA